MPLGLKNAPSEFQHQMDEVYTPLYSNCLIYIDDVLIFSKTVEEHKQYLRKF